MYIKMLEGKNCELYMVIDHIEHKLLRYQLRIKGTKCSVGYELNELTMAIDHCLDRIPRCRLEEIATKALHSATESADDWFIAEMQDELGMTEEEEEFFGLKGVFTGYELPEDEY